MHFGPNDIYKNELTLEDKQSIYESCLKNFKDRGQEESFKRLDIEYKDFKWNNSTLSWLAWLPHYWWNYGYNKELIFLWIAVFLLLFSLINYFNRDYLNQQVYTVEYIPDGNKALSPQMRFWYSFIYTATIFFRLTLKMEKVKFNRVLGTLYIVLIYLAGIICLAYVANFVLQH